MLGTGAGGTPKTAYAALSVRLLHCRGSGLSSGLAEVQRHLDNRDDTKFTAAQDRRFRAYDGMGLSKPEKVALTNVPLFKHGDSIDKWMVSVWNSILLHQGGAALQNWVHEENCVVNGLQPPPHIMHTAVHTFTARGTDSASLEAMVECGELFGATPRALSMGDKVELLVEMPTEIKGETKAQWIDKRATIVKVEAGRFLIHVEGDHANDSTTTWFKFGSVR